MCIFGKQVDPTDSMMCLIWSDEDEFIKYKSRGVGKGHSKAGKRRTWRKNFYFEQDLLTLFATSLDEKAFTARFAGYQVREIQWFFQKIKKKALRPKETEIHCQNKLLLWLDKLHNCLTYQQIKAKYCIGMTTARNHINDILQAILNSFENENVVSFPNKKQRERMVKILKTKNVPVPDALFALDGSHTRCTGRHIRERISKKYNWLPCFNVTFIIERVLGTVCAFNLDSAASKHDITTLRESWFYQHLNELMNGWIILADKGYVGVQKDGINCIAAVLRKNMKARKHFSKGYWHQVNVARSDVERTFGDFFHNKFTQLGQWPGKSNSTFTEFSANVICCIILYNTIKTNFRPAHFLLKQ